MRLLFYTLLLLNISLLSGTSVYASEDIKIPPATQLRDGWIPSVNQFILMPSEGHVLVYYLGVFNNSGSALEQEQNTKKFIPPLPKNAMNVQILNEGSEQIQISFTLKAPFGHVNWEPDNLRTLPGVTILMMNDATAKIMMSSANFIQDFNKTSPSGQQFVRVSWSADTPYPEFKIVNMIPSRAWIYVVVGLVGCFLFLTLFLVYRRASPLCSSSAKC